MHAVPLPCYRHEALSDLPVLKAQSWPVWSSVKGEGRRHIVQQNPYFIEDQQTSRGTYVGSPSLGHSHPALSARRESCQLCTHAEQSYIYSTNKYIRLTARCRRADETSLHHRSPDHLKRDQNLLVDKTGFVSFYSCS